MLRGPSGSAYTHIKASHAGAQNAKDPAADAARPNITQFRFRQNAIRLPRI
ncbi:MAG: hypothetical protein K2H37_15090 [Lachnospiraceae bacterium]|nr:hypothetical protein [Lachnospiraceae bacterium]MDE5940389.1 hypothetical protein [Lachnospiraceae bacterium]